MHRILAAVDLSDSTQPVLRFSAELARQEKANLSILYAMPVATPINAVAWSGGIYSVSPMGDDQADYELSLALLHQIANGTGVSEADCLCERGSAVDKIRDMASRIHADVIVLGTHGHGRFFHTMFGSVRESLLRDAPCPVVVVPNHGEDGASA
ncbi:MAG: universal stress protein [Polyangiaceae bacterium]